MQVISDKEVLIWTQEFRTAYRDLDFNSENITKSVEKLRDEFLDKVFKKFKASYSEEKMQFFKLVSLCNETMAFKDVFMGLLYTLELYFNPDFSQEEVIINLGIKKEWPRFMFMRDF